MNNSDINTSCLENTLCIIGDQWTALILHDLSADAQTFSQLEGSLKGISPRTLSQRLERLGKEGIIEKIDLADREVIRGAPVRIDRAQRLRRQRSARRSALTRIAWHRFP